MVTEKKIVKTYRIQIKNEKKKLFYIIYLVNKFK